MDDARRELIDAIADAFRDTPRGEITLHEAEAIDSYATAEERDRARRRDVATRWQDIPDAHVEACPNALPHLDPVSWAHYLPRFMTWTLANLACTQSLAVDHTLYALLLHEGEGALNEALRARFDRLSPEQTRVIERFLAHLAQHDDRCDALAAETARAAWARRAERG